MEYGFVLHKVFTYIITIYVWLIFASMLVRNELTKTSLVNCSSVGQNNLCFFSDCLEICNSSIYWWNVQVQENVTVPLWLCEIIDKLIMLIISGHTESTNLNLFIIAHAFNLNTYFYRVRFSF